MSPTKNTNPAGNPTVGEMSINGKPVRPGTWDQAPDARRRFEERARKLANKDKPQSDEVRSSPEQAP